VIVIQIAVVIAGLGIDDLIVLAVVVVGRRDAA
jgi:hypothetical protein